MGTCVHLSFIMLQFINIFCTIQPVDQSLVNEATNVFTTGLLNVTSF